MQLEIDSRNRGDGVAILPIRGDGLVFERGGRRILDGIDIEIGGTGTLVLIGPNGAGKSLLVRVLAGLVAPTAGEVTWAGAAPDRRRAPRSASCFNGPSCCAARRWPTSSMPWRLPAWRGRSAAGARMPLSSVPGSRIWRIRPRGSCPAASSSSCRSPAPWRRARIS